MDNDTKEKLETEKVAKREKAVAKQNNEDSKKRQTFTIDDTGLKSKKFPRLAASLQGAFLAGLGEVITSMIKDTPQDAERVATFVIWGARASQRLPALSAPRPIPFCIARPRVAPRKGAGALPAASSLVLAARHRCTQTHAGAWAVAQDSC